MGVKLGARLKGANLKPACGIDGTPINCVLWRHSDVYSGDFTMATTSDKRKKGGKKEGKGAGRKEGRKEGKKEGRKENTHNLSQSLLLLGLC